MADDGGHQAFLDELIAQAPAIDVLLEEAAESDDWTEYEQWEKTGEIPERLQHLIQR